MKPQCYLLKRLFLVPALFVAMLVTVRAQQQKTDDERSLSPKFGIKAGVNLSNLYVDEVQDENVKVGYNFGLLAKLPIVRGLSIQPELLYSSKGAKLTYSGLFGSGEYRYNLNYVEVPVLAVVNLVKNFNVHAGGYASYLAGVNVKDMGNDGTVYDVTKLSADDFNRFDYGLIGGLGVDVQNVTIAARYNYGLREVGKEGTNRTSDYMKNSKNSVISLYLGFGF